MWFLVSVLILYNVHNFSLEPYAEYQGMFLSLEDCQNKADEFTNTVPLSQKDNEKYICVFRPGQNKYK